MLLHCPVNGFFALERKIRNLASTPWTPVNSILSGEILRSESHDAKGKFLSDGREYQVIVGPKSVDHAKKVKL